MKKVCKEICNNISFAVLKEDNFQQFLSENHWLDQGDFKEICGRYGYPQKTLTIVIEHYYIDAVYRDAYYNYWSRAHFDWPRACRRLFLFHNEHNEQELFARKQFNNLENDFLGTIVIRPSYSSATDHTFGRTLLNPYKMQLITEAGIIIYPFEYLATAEYTVHLLGNTYTTQAFPFLSQDGAVMKCAETAVCELCDYAASFSEQYARVLPSDIQAQLKERLPERILPSHGLYCNDISFLLSQFGFSPMIYAETRDIERAEIAKGAEQELDSLIGIIASDGVTAENATTMDNQTWDNQHKTGFKEWFHYYVESGIPILTITAPSQEVNKHAALVIGHGKKRKSLDDCRIYQLGKLPCMDTSELYEDYIVQDDNQIPYAEEKMDRFTREKNYKLVAFIVPLDHHVFLDASSAINICDSFISQESEMIYTAISDSHEKYEQAKTNGDEQERDQYEYLAKAFMVSEENPVSIRYYLANSAEYKVNRISNGQTNDDKKFYADIAMPKRIWVAEISTYRLYEMGYAFAEVVIDATASNRSMVNSIILLKLAHMGVYRLPNETYDVFNKKLETKECYFNLTPVFPLFSNFSKEEIDESDISIICE